MSEKKAPTKCNHCQSTDIIFHQWGRTEYYSCKSCKNEVPMEVVQEQTNTWGAWDPKTYGFSSSSFTLPEGYYLDNFDGFEGSSEET
jgi:hypothetical protein